MPIDFNAKAAEFIARVQAADLSLLADVAVILHVQDVRSGERRKWSAHVMPKTSTGGPPLMVHQSEPLDNATCLAVKIDNINLIAESLQRCSSTPRFRLEDIELKITERAP